MAKSEDLIVWKRTDDELRLAARCAMCNGMGRIFGSNEEFEDCDHCLGCGWFGIDPLEPVMGPPGSIEKVAMLSVRYALGIPLWNGSDGRMPERTAADVAAAAAEESFISTVASQSSPPSETVIRSLVP